MATGHTSTRTCRWDQIEVGDIVLDPRWRWQRWETVTKIENHGGTIEAWFGRDEDKRGYSAGAANLVGVQVIISDEPT